MQTRDEVDERQGVQRPPNMELPIFVYGLLQPGELGHDQIRAEVDRPEDATAWGALRILDGLPIFDPNLSGHVRGSVFTLTVLGYEAVSAFEPSSIYRWATTRVRVGDLDQIVEANVLVATVDEGGRSILERADGGDVVESWSAASDPLLAYGLGVVSEMAIVDAAEPFGPSNALEVQDWRRFYRVQAAYLLACTVLERIAVFSCGNVLGPTARINELDRDLAFREAARSAGVSAPRRSVGRSDDPFRRQAARTSGAGFVRRAYQVRSNLMHRGKSAYAEAELVRLSLLDLHDALRLYLLLRLPQLANMWAAVEPEGTNRGWRLKQHSGVHS